MKRIITTLLCIFWCSGAYAAVTFNPSDNSSMTLSNGNLTATSPNFVASGVRSTTSYSSGNVCFEAKANTISQDWTLGVADATFNLANPGGVGFDTHAIGIDVNNPGVPQGIFYNNNAISSGSTASVNGEVVTVCANFSTKLLWITDSVMRAASTPWNNSASASPASGTGGASFSAMTCPCFIIFNEAEVGVATLNATGPFAVTTPSGFTAWQPAGTPGNHGVAIIVGANYALHERRRSD